MENNSDRHTSRVNWDNHNIDYDKLSLFFMIYISFPQENLINILFLDISCNLTKQYKLEKALGDSTTKNLTGERL